MSKSDLGPEYLKAEDLIRDNKWSSFALVIKEVIPADSVRGSDKKLIDKPILVFENARKKLILNVTNIRLMTYACGSSVREDWIGKRIVVRACKGNWYGEEGTTAIRLALPKGSAKPFIKKSVMGEDLTGQYVVPPSNSDSQEVTK